MLTRQPLTLNLSKVRKENFEKIAWKTAFIFWSFYMKWLTNCCTVFKAISFIIIINWFSYVPFVWHASICIIESQNALIRLLGKSLIVATRSVLPRITDDNWEYSWTFTFELMTINKIFDGWWAVLGTLN